MQISLTAESSSIKFNVDPTDLDLGCQLYDRRTEREVSIWNQGKVPFEYKLKWKNKSVIECIPCAGRIGRGNKEAVKIKVKAFLARINVDRDSHLWWIFIMPRI